MQHWDLLFARLALRWWRAYILLLCFFLFFCLFLTPNLCGHWTHYNQTWTHTHLWLLFEKFGLKFLGRLPSRAGRQITFFCDRLWTLTKNICATEHDISKQDTLQAHIRGTFQFNQFARWRLWLTLMPRALLALMTLCAGQAHAGLCHASSVLKS